MGDCLCSNPFSALYKFVHQLTLLGEVLTSFSFYQKTGTLMARQRFQPGLTAREIFVLPPLPYVQKWGENFKMIKIKFFEKMVEAYKPKFMITNFSYFSLVCGSVCFIIILPLEEWNGALNCSQKRSLRSVGSTFKELFGPYCIAVLKNVRCCISVGI